jgi:hypothetical protein
MKSSMTKINALSLALSLLLTEEAVRGGAF